MTDSHHIHVMVYSVRAQQSVQLIYDLPADRKQFERLYEGCMSNSGYDLRFTSMSKSRQKCQECNKN